MGTFRPAATPLAATCLAFLLLARPEYISAQSKRWGHAKHRSTAVAGLLLSLSVKPGPPHGSSPGALNRLYSDGGLLYDAAVAAVGQSIQHEPVGSSPTTSIIGLCMVRESMRRSE